MLTFKNIPRNNFTVSYTCQGGLFLPRLNFLELEACMGWWGG